jgi:WD40 repeat protein
LTRTKQLENVSRAGLIGVGTDDGGVALWSLAEKKKVRTLEGYYKQHSKVVFSPDGVWSCGITQGKPVKVWQNSSDSVKGTLVTKRNDFSLAAFSPNGQMIASGSQSGEIIIWDRSSAKEILGWRNFDLVWSMAFSPDGNTLATVGGFRAGGLNLWNIETRKQAHSLEYRSIVCDVRFSQDGKAIVTGHQNGTFRIWSWTKAPNKNPFAPITVTAQTIRDGEQVKDYSVWYVPKAHKGDADCYKSFLKLTSPTSQPVPAGNYVMWVTKGKYAGDKINNVRIDSVSPSDIQFPVN